MPLSNYKSYLLIRTPNFIGGDEGCEEIQVCFAQLPTLEAWVSKASTVCIHDELLLTAALINGDLTTPGFQMDENIPLVPQAHKSRQQPWVATFGNTYTSLS